MNGFEVVLIRGRSSVRPLSFCTEEFLYQSERSSDRAHGVTRLPRRCGKTCNQRLFPVVFPEIRTKAKMKNVSLIIALTFAASSIMAAPLPDPSKLPPVSKQEGVTFEKDIHPI